MKRTFWKEAAVFLVVFVGTCGLIQADIACSEAVGKEPYMGINLQKTSEDMLTAYGFGGSVNVNTAMIKKQVDEIIGNYKELLNIISLKFS